MRVFLRNKKSRLYCAGSKGWAPAIGQAVEFASVQRAVTFAVEKSLPESEVVLRCDILAAEVTLPLVPEWRDFHQSGSAAA